MLNNSPFLRFLASKLGDGQALFLLTLETVDPGTGMMWSAANTFLAADKFFSSKKSSQLEKCSLVVKAVWRSDEN